MKCKYCEHGPGNLHLNHATRNKTDISIKLTNGGMVLHCTHYDIEGDTNDAQEDVLINYCPMCGRELRKLPNEIKDLKRQQEQGYTPVCPKGYEDCVHDPAYVRLHHPDWYKHLYGDRMPIEAVRVFCITEPDDSCYDDEDK